MSEQIRNIGIIGIGHHGTRYLNFFLENQIGYTLISISRINVHEGEKIAKEKKIKYFKDFKKLIEDPELDAVIVVTPPSLHEEILIHCQIFGKPVLIEKPFSTSIKSVNKIIKFYNKYKTPIMVAHHLRFDPIINLICKELENIGEISFIKITQWFKKANAKWVDSEKTIGTNFITGVHGFDLITYLTKNKIKSVFAVARKILTTNNIDTFVSIIELVESNAIIVIDNTRASGGRNEKIEITGTNFSLIGDITHRTLTKITNSKKELISDFEDKEPPLLKGLRSFLNCLSNNLPLPISVDDSTYSIKIAEACSESITKRKIIMINNSAEKKGHQPT